jgi:hypothetical protein
MFPFSLSGILVAALGLLISPAHGLLLFFPLTWLALPGLRRLARSARGAAILFGGFLVAPFIVYATYYAWWGGAWSWGPRYLVPSLPILAVGAAAWAADGRRPARRALFVAFAAAGVIVSWNGMLFDPLDFGRWMRVGPGGLRDDAVTQFRLAASPIVMGWFEPRDRSLDIVWLRALDPEQIRRYGRLVANGGGGRWPDLVEVVRVSSVLVVAALLSWLVLAGRKLKRLTLSSHSKR